MPTEHDGFGRKYCAVYDGIVVDNKDPLNAGRARIRVPGICEPSSAWARPLGGGGNRRGTFNPPDVGDEVAVWFVAGDLDNPRYARGHFGAPGGQSQASGPVGGYKGKDDQAEEFSSENAVKVKSWEGDRYVVMVDERAGKERLVLRDKKSDDCIEFDGVNMGVLIQVTSMLKLKALGLVDIEGANVQINGRTVVSNGKPIQ